MHSCCTGPQAQPAEAERLTRFLACSATNSRPTRIRRADGRRRRGPACDPRSGRGAGGQARERNRRRAARQRAVVARGKIEVAAAKADAQKRAAEIAAMDRKRLRIGGVDGSVARVVQPGRFHERE